MKWLIINTEAFSPAGLKQKKVLSFDDLPWVIRKFLSVFPKNFVVLDESSKIRTSMPMKEEKKSSRTRLIKLLGKYAHEKCIMTGTLMSKSPINIIDQYDFLKTGYIPENVYEFAEKYCVMMTLRVGRGRRIIIGQKDYADVRRRLKNAFIRGGELAIQAAQSGIFRQYGISYAKQEHIVRNRKYTPFVNQEELLKRIAPDTMFVKREDVFDISFDKFVKEPISRPVELSNEAKKIGNELIDLGFTDNLTLGKSASLELFIRLQDICNGFEPLKDEDGNITYRPFKENAKVDALMELLEEIGVEDNQVVIWSSRKLLIKSIKKTLELNGISVVVYDGDQSNDEKKKAQTAFENKEAQVFLANQATGAYGLNCLAQCSYMVWMCIDGSVEYYYQALHRILRGQLTSPKFAYAIYAKGSVEERQWNSLRVGQELINADNRKDTFVFK